MSPLLIIILYLGLLLLLGLFFRFVVFLVTHVVLAAAPFAFPLLVVP